VESSDRTLDSPTLLPSGRVRQLLTKKCQFRRELLVEFGFRIQDLAAHGRSIA
jgi:hypothetical protein